MKVVVVGSGGREHAICESVLASRSLSKLFCIPGNVGISAIAECVDIITTDNNKIGDFCKQNKIDLVIVGPEVPLCNGLVDHLESIGIMAFGPKKKESMIEGSKVFMKNFCKENNIPTAQYKSFSSPKNSIEDVLIFASTIGYPIVLKTDGLASGKGVVICENESIFKNEVKDYFSGKFGDAGKAIIVEEFLDGYEVSFFAISDGEAFISLDPACDYKRVYDNDLGKNTGGMGSFSSSKILTTEQIDLVNKQIISPLIEGMKKIDLCYKGVIFAGLMIGSKGIRLLEFNCRFGDPETQAILPRLQTDFIDIAIASIKGGIKNITPKFLDNASVNVVIASGGYPDSFEKDKKIDVKIQSNDNLKLFYSGVKQSKDGFIVTDGGRVMSVCAICDNFASARALVYEAIGKVKFDGMHYRSDIALKAKG